MLLKIVLPLCLVCCLPRSSIEFWIDQLSSLFHFWEQEPHLTWWASISDCCCETEKKQNFHPCVVAMVTRQVFQVCNISSALWLAKKSIAYLTPICIFFLPTYYTSLIMQAAGIISIQFCSGTFPGAWAAASFPKADGTCAVDTRDHRHQTQGPCWVQDYPKRC